MKHCYKTSTQKGLAQIFDAHGRPVEIKSEIGSYVPYDSDSDMDIFDEGMFMLTRGAKSVVVVY